MQYTELISLKAKQQRCMPLMYRGEAWNSRIRMELYPKHGIVDKASLSLADASIGATTTKPGHPSTESTTISLSGALTNKNANKAIIGSVTVKIADADTASQE